MRQKKCERRIVLGVQADRRRTFDSRKPDLPRHTIERRAVKKRERRRRVIGDRHVVEAVTVKISNCKAEGPLPCSE